EVDRASLSVRGWVSHVRPPSSTLLGKYLAFLYRAAAARLSSRRPPPSPATRGSDRCHSTPRTLLEHPRTASPTHTRERHAHFLHLKRQSERERDKQVPPPDPAPAQSPTMEVVMFRNTTSKPPI